MKTLFWIQGLSCEANTQSFLCMEQKDLLENIEVLYHPLSDKSLEESVRLLLKDEKELDILIVEGAIGKSIRHVCSYSFSNIVKNLQKLNTLSLWEIAPLLVESTQRQAPQNLILIA